MGIRPALSLAVLAVFAASVIATACGTSAIGVDECKQLESARCNRAQACGVSLENPPHTDGTDVTSCIRFYDVECLHGLTTASDPGSVAVAACLTAINNGPCTTVVHPETDPACAFLVPPPPVVDAAADATDAETDADSETDSGDAE